MDAKEMNNTAQAARPAYIFYSYDRSRLSKKAITKETAHFYFVDDTRIPKKDLESGYYRKSISKWSSAAYYLPTAELEERFSQQQVALFVRECGNKLYSIQQDAEIAKMTREHPQLLDILQQLFKQ